MNNVEMSTGQTGGSLPRDPLQPFTFLSRTLHSQNSGALERAEFTCKSQADRMLDPEAVGRDALLVATDRQEHLSPAK